MTEGSAPGARRRARQLPPPSWLAAGAALGERMAQLARADQKVKQFRKVLHAAGPRHRECLRAIAQRLARSLADCYWWGVNDAMTFLTTNATPPRSPIRAKATLVMSGESGRRIVLEVEDWVPPDAVRAVYARLHGHGSSRSTRVRTITRAALDVVAFVEGTSGSWAERLRQWNTLHPKNVFKDRANFRRAYHQTARRFDVRPTFLGA